MPNNRLSKMGNDKEKLPSSNDRLSDIHNRADRIDVLVKIAKQEFDKNKSYSEIIQKLNFEMTGSWTLSPGTQKEYLNAVRTKFQYNYGIKLQSKDGIDCTEIDNKIIKGKSEKRISDNELFCGTLRNLEGEDKTPVKEVIFVSELEKTGRFTRDVAENLIKKMQTKSAIYESKPGHYNLV